MRVEQVVKPSRVRHWLVLLLLFAAMLGIMIRLTELMVWQRNFLQNQGNARSVRVLSIPAYRGMITDRNGEPLAISTLVASVWINPLEVDPTDDRIPKLAKLLHISPKTISSKLIPNTTKEFIYLKRSISPALADQIKALAIPGIFIQSEYRRFYPEGEVVSHVLGFTNIDDEGQEGIELAYNDWLKGVSGKKRVIKDRLGHVVEDLSLLAPPKAGHDLVLSIDRRIQYLAYRELKEAFTKFQAQSASVIVMDVRTGEVLAMANLPSFNPNNHENVPADHTRNRAVTDVFEPGSALKSFAVANALASGKFKPNTIVNTLPGWMMVEGHKVQDIHHAGLMSVTEILKVSSNVGVSKLTLALPSETLIATLLRFGFGERTDLGYPGESSGKFPWQKKWRPFSLSTLSFGYGISVTALQLTRAYCSLANGGLLCSVSLLKSLGPPNESIRIVPEEVANNIVKMLETVTGAGGTATMARVPGYRVSGKTGTTRVVGRHGYEESRHNSIFVGIAPASNPRIVVSVVIQDPQGKVYYGGHVAGPVFAKVMSGALRIMNVPPDDVLTDKGKG